MIITPRDFSKFTYFSFSVIDDYIFSANLVKITNIYANRLKKHKVGPFLTQFDSIICPGKHTTWRFVCKKEQKHQLKLGQIESNQFMRNLNQFEPGRFKIHCLFL